MDPQNQTETLAAVQLTAAGNVAMRPPTTCSLEGIRYHLIEYHVFAVEEDDSIDFDQPDSYRGRESDCHPYSCKFHGEDFTTWDDVVRHLGGRKPGEVLVAAGAKS